MHPEAVAFAGHCDFDPDVLAAYRPTGKGRVERQVLIVRDHVLAGRAFSSVEELNAAFTAWVPLRRAKVHGTHGEVIGLRAVRDRMALRPLPATPYVVTQRHPATSARTASSPSKRTSTRYRPNGSGRASWSRSAPRSPRSPCMPPHPTTGERPC